MAGISLQDFSVLKIKLQDIFFSHHFYHPPPLPSKVKWSAPYKPFAHDRRAILAFCIITAKHIRDRSLFIPWGSVVTENPKGGIAKNFGRIQRGDHSKLLGKCRHVVGGGGEAATGIVKVIKSYSAGSLQGSNIQRGDRLVFTLFSPKFISYVAQSFESIFESLEIAF